jgi:hypothetical protein
MAAPEKPKKKSLRKTLTAEQKSILEAGPVLRTPQQLRLALRQQVRMFYDLQRLRLQSMGRVLPKAVGAEIILHPYDLTTLEARGQNLLTAEKLALKDVEDLLNAMPFYIDVLSDKDRFRGIGPTMAGVILSEFDIHRSDTPSKFWAFAGLAPVPVRRCSKCFRTIEFVNATDQAHTKWVSRKPKLDAEGKEVPQKKITCEFDGKPIPANFIIDSAKAAKPTKGEKLHYNSFLRAKLCGVLGPILLKCDSPWRVHYDNFKQRWISAGKGINDAHRHAAAIRYMIKMLLAEIWGEWRKAEGLALRPSYAEEKLGMHHVGGTGQKATPIEEQLTPEQMAELEQIDRPRPEA